MDKRIIAFLTSLVLGIFSFILAQQSLISSQWSAPSGFNVLTVADQYAYQAQR